MSNSLGSKLRRLREEHGWTQLYAAKLFGITNGALSNYERDFRVPDNDLLKKFAEKYGTTIDYLLGHTNYRKSVNSDMVSDALKDDPELVGFWNEMQEREDLKVLFKKSKRLKPDDVKQIIRMIKLIEDEEDELNR